MLTYPSNVPFYNSARFLTSGAIDLDDKTILSVRMPSQFVYYFMGAFSLLMDVNEWEKYGSLTPEEMVDIAVNEVEFVEICELVADCIENDTDVQQALSLAILSNAGLQQTINTTVHNMLTAGTGTQQAESQFDNLDYVWGGLLNAIEEYDNAVNMFALVANSVTTAEEFLLDNLVPKYLTQMIVDKVSAAIGLGVTAVISFLEDPDTRNDFMCGIFDAICTRNQPYILYPEDIEKGWDAINALSSFGIPGIDDLVRIFFSVDKFLQIFQIGSDEPDNDWEILCGCEPTWVYEWFAGDTLDAAITLVNGNSTVSGIEQVTGGSGSIPRITLDMDISISDELWEVEYTYSRVNNGATASSAADALAILPSNVLLNNTGVPTGEYSRSWLGAETADNTLRLFFTNGNSGSPATFGTLLLTYFKVRGTGTNPFS